MALADLIRSALPANREWAMNALLVLAALYRGEKVHLYTGSHFNGRRRELHNTAGVSQAEAIIEKAGIKIQRGNDAPRGGELGKYISLPRRSLRIAAQLMVIHGELYASVRGYPCSLYDEYGRENGGKWED